jgi:hypothetical protein
MTTRYFTIGDTLVSYFAELYRPGDVPVALDVGDTVLFHMVARTTGLVKVDRAAARIVFAGSALLPAWVAYDWLALDVDTAGEYAAWFIRVSSALSEEHFPAQSIISPSNIIIFRPNGD